jgi:hypothetical protein
MTLPKSWFALGMKRLAFSGIPSRPVSRDMLDFQPAPASVPLTATRWLAPFLLSK